MAKCDVQNENSCIYMITIIINNNSSKTKYHLQRNGNVIVDDVIVELPFFQGEL